MPEDRISYSLTAFEKVEIIRAEIEAAEEELAQIEVRLRSIHFAVERLRFLAGIAKGYARSSAPDGYAELESLEAKRAELAETLDALKAIQPRVEAEATGVAPPAAQAAGPSGLRPQAAPGAPGGMKRRGFESFDDFRSKKPK